MSRIGITGAAGYLGKQIVSLLMNRGIDVVPLVHSKKKDSEIVCDLTNPEMVYDVIDENNIGIIIHCAASVPKKWAEYDNGGNYQRNVEMLKNICQLSLKRVIFCSSMSVYGENAEGMLEEDMLAIQSNAYARSKIDGEKWLHESNQKNFVIARLPGLFGAGRSNGLIFNVINSLLENKLPELEQKPPAWSAIHVNDAAELLSRLAILNMPIRTTCNIGYGMPQSIVRLVNDLIALMKLEGITLPYMRDNWVCQNINRQLRYVGYAPNHWYQRLTEEIRIMESLKCSL